MLKKTLLSAVLLFANGAMAHIKLDFDLTVHKRNGFSQRQIVTEIILCQDEDEIVNLGEFDPRLENLTVHLLAQELASSDELLIICKVTEKAENGETITIAEPTIKAQWNKNATLTIFNENNEGFVFIIKASRIN